MSHQTRPHDIPPDLAAWLEIGGPWSVRVLYAGFLLRYVASLLAPWRPGAVLEVRRRVVEELRA